MLSWTLASWLTVYNFGVHFQIKIINENNSKTFASQIALAACLVVVSGCCVVVELDVVGPDVVVGVIAEHSAGFSPYKQLKN